MQLPYDDDCNIDLEAIVPLVAKSIKGSVVSLLWDACGGADDVRKIPVIAVLEATVCVDGLRGFFVRS